MMADPSFLCPVCGELVHETVEPATAWNALHNAAVSSDFLIAYLDTCSMIGSKHSSGLMCAMHASMISVSFILPSTI